MSIWQRTKVLVCCCDYQPLPPSQKLLTFKYSRDFIVYFFNPSKYLRAHFSHYRITEAAIVGCALKQSNGKKIFNLTGIFRKHVIACTHLLRYTNSIYKLNCFKSRVSSKKNILGSKKKTNTWLSRTAF